VSDPDQQVRHEQEVVKRQRERARLMAWLLGGFVILLFFITVAKIGLQP
jgi:hypothetical protein